MNISIVIISYNSERFLEASLQSVLLQSIPFLEIIVVDNCSTDKSREIVQSFGNTVSLISLKQNSGYSQAANIGIKQSHSDLVVIANSDTIFESTFNKMVLDKFEADPDIDLLSPLLLRFDKKTVDSAGQSCSKSLYPCEIGFNRPKRELSLEEGPVFSVCGAATVFRRSALAGLEMEGEYYDEDFFIFWEDFDIGWRAQLLGMKIWFFPEAVVYHYRSGTLKQNFLSRFSLALARPPAIKYHLVKNRILVLIKNFRLKSNFTHIPFIIFKDIIWIAMLTFSSPKIIIPLMKSAKYIKRALIKRQAITEQMKTRRH